MKACFLFINLSILILFSACNQERVNPPADVEAKIQQFIYKEKFMADDALFYPGLGDRRLRLILSGKMNEAAKGFSKVAQDENPTALKFHQEMDLGLASFREFALDSEEIERICHYYEELMDIVGLQSSAGRLNKFRYGFDPS